MRFLLVILLIALTPLRSWAGDAMAIRMAAGTQGTGHTEVAKATSAREDCAGGHHNAAPTQTSAGQESQDHCANCAFCQACFTVALTGLPAVLAPLVPHNSPPWAGLKFFASAEVALGQKPPIS